MKRKKIEKIFKKSIEVYGKESQSRQAMEECAELVHRSGKRGGRHFSGRTGRR